MKKIDICNKEIRRYPWIMEEDAHSSRLLFVPKVTKKNFAQLEKIDMMGRKTTISLSLSSIYYSSKSTSVKNDA